MPPSTRITIISSDSQLASHIQLRLHSKGCQVAVMAFKESSVGIFYSDPPDLLILDLSAETARGIEIVTTLRADSFFSAIPIIGLIGSSDSTTLDWEQCPSMTLLNCHLILMSFSTAYLWRFPASSAFLTTTR